MLAVVDIYKKSVAWRSTFIYKKSVGDLVKRREDAVHWPGSRRSPVLCKHLTEIDVVVVALICWLEKEKVGFDFDLL